MTQGATTTHTIPYSTNGQTRSWIYSYCAAGDPNCPVGLLKSVDGPLAGTGDKIAYAYDANGFVNTITNEVGQVTAAVTKNASGLPTKVRDANLIDTDLTYDERDRLKTSATAGALTSYAYNLAGDVTRITRPDGSYLDYTYDNARRVTLIANNTGEKIELGYNANSDETSRTIKTSGGTIVYQQSQTFDELGRLLRRIGAASQQTGYAYDRTDNLVQVTDPRSNLYAYAYDALQRLFRETDEEGSQVNLTRDAQDKITAYSDPRTLVTTYVRNGFGEAIQEASPDAGTTVYVRDARGLVTQMTDGRGIVANMTYDNGGRRLTATYPAATAENVTYTYDATASGNKGIGRLTKVQDQSGSTEYVYDALGRITSNKRTIGTKVYTVAYVYDAASHVTQITYPSGRIVIYARNSLGQVSGVTTKQNAGAAVVNVATGLTWKPMSNLLAGMTHGNGLVTTASYDLDYRLTSLLVQNVATNVISLSYAYSDGMNLTVVNDNVTPANSVSLWYNPANRLQNADGPWGQATYYYDGVGNRTQEIVTQGATTTRLQSYPANSNRMGNMTENGANLRTYTYDGAGNILTDARPGETYAFTYNKRNRPVSVTRNSTAYATYSYNALEQMVSRSTTAAGGPTGTVHYIYDLDGHILIEADAANGGTLREYIWLAANDNTEQGTDLPIGVVVSVPTTPNLLMVHADHLGRPIRMTDGAKATVWTALWTPWGKGQQINGPQALNLRLPGQYYLIETNLSYNWHRHYDTVTGRYAQADPLRFVDGPSIYAYAGNSPLMLTDPFGLWVIFLEFGGTFSPGAGATGGFGFVLDSDLNFDSYLAGGGSVGFDVSAGMSLGGGTGMICDFEGLSHGADVSVGEGIALGGGTYIGSGTGSKGGYGQASVGIKSLPAGVKAYRKYTTLGSSPLICGCKDLTQ